MVLMHFIVQFCTVLLCGMQYMIQVRKSGRAPKPTEKLLEGKQQEMKTVNDEEESVDAIAIAAGTVVDIRPHPRSHPHPHFHPHPRCSFQSWKRPTLR